MRYRKKGAAKSSRAKPKRTLRMICETFEPAVALSQAVEQLKLAQAIRHPYAPKQGHRVAVAAVPLALAPTLNVLAEMHPWKRKEVKERCAACMAQQVDAHAVPPTSGQPTVVMLRFTSAPRNDHDMAFTKIPLDRLTDFGLIPDDSTEAIHLVAKCVKCRPGEGFVYMEVWHE